MDVCGQGPGGTCNGEKGAADTKATKLMKIHSLLLRGDGIPTPASRSTAAMRRCSPPARAERSRPARLPGALVCRALAEPLSRRALVQQAGRYSHNLHLSRQGFLRQRLLSKRDRCLVSVLQAPTGCPKHKACAAVPKIVHSHRCIISPTYLQVRFIESLSDIKEYLQCTSRPSQCSLVPATMSRLRRPRQGL